MDGKTTTTEPMGLSPNVPNSEWIYDLNDLMKKKDKEALGWLREIVK